MAPSTPDSASSESRSLRRAAKETIQEFTDSMKAKLRNFVFRKNNITPNRQKSRWWSYDNAAHWGADDVGAFLRSQDSRSSPPLPDSPTSGRNASKKRARSPSLSLASLKSVASKKSPSVNTTNKAATGSAHEDADDDEVVVTHHIKKLSKAPPRKRVKTTANATKGKGRQAALDDDRTIRVTSKEKVAQVVTINKAPTTWTVPRKDTAYILDMSGEVIPMAKNENDELVEMDMATYIRGQDQESWTQISGGSRTHAPKVKLLDNVPCRRVEVHCSGISHCDQVGPDFLAGVERWEPETAQRDELFKAQQELRARDGATRIGQTIHFYNRINGMECDHETKTNVKCNGEPVLKTINKVYDLNDGRPRPPLYQTQFIGCSKWSPGQNDHIHQWIPAEVDIPILMRLLRGERVDDIEGAEAYAGPCSYTFHPRHNKQHHCPFAHIRPDTGKAVVGKMVPRECSVHMLIFSPVDPTIRKAVVIIREGPHNHPTFPEEKPTYEARADIRAAAEAQGVAGVTSEKLNNSATTRALLDGQNLDQKHPALLNRRHIRRAVKEVKTDSNPLGLDWAGLLKLQEEEQALPADQRYIQVMTVQDGVHLSITMLRPLAELLHEAEYFVHDFTFKHTAGVTNSADVVTAIRRYNNKRITVARIYMDKSSEFAYGLMWDGFFAAVEQATGRPLKLKPFHKDGNVKLIILDGEAAQIQALGTKLLKLNDPLVSGIPNTSRNDLLAHIGRTCFFHWADNANDTARSEADREDAEILKDFVHYNTQEQIDQFYSWCENSTNVKIINWYNNKKSLPWYFPSVNGFLSKVPADDWAILPSTSNHAETAHVANNAATGINLSLVEAVTLGKKYDTEVAEHLARIDKTCIIPNHLNTAKNVQKRNGIRRTKRMEKKRETRARNNEISQLQAEQKEHEAVRKAAAARKKEITERVKALKAAGNGNVASSAGSQQPGNTVLGDPDELSSTEDAGEAEAVEGEDDDDMPEEADLFDMPFDAALEVRRTRSARPIRVSQKGNCCWQEFELDGVDDDLEGGHVLVGLAGRSSDLLDFSSLTLRHDIAICREAERGKEVTFVVLGGRTTIESVR